MCRLSTSFHLKALPQRSQTKGRASVCRCRCRLRCPFSVKLCGHSGHW